MSRLGDTIAEAIGEIVEASIKSKLKLASEED